MTNHEDTKTLIKKFLVKFTIRHPYQKDKNL